MRLPTPMAVLKGPRLTELSNLEGALAPASKVKRQEENILGAHLLGGTLIIQAPGVVHGDLVTLLGVIHLVTLLEDLLSDTHDGNSLLGGG